MEHSSPDSFVAVVAIMVIFGLPISYAIANRWWAHRERLAMIERGIVPPTDAWWKNADYAARAQARAARGMPDAGFSDPNRTLRKGITLTMIGFALVIGLSFIRLGEPGPWLLGGLIPMFVGLAQVLTALMSGARLGVTVMPPPQAPPSDFGPARDVSPGPYAWRPTGVTELENPAKPPDVKQ